MARKGFFAELQRQARIAERDREKRQREAERGRVARQKELERARVAAERARAQLSKAQAAELSKAEEAERKRLEREAKEAYLEERRAEVEDRNEALESVHEDLASLLAWTLSHDDYVDLNTLRIKAEHPPFDRSDLQSPTPAPVPIGDPPRPVLQLPEPPRGLAKLFGKKRHAEAVESANRTHELALSDWVVQCKRAATQRQSAKERHAQSERKRLEQLANEQARYAKECEAREAEAKAHNLSVDELLANLGYGTVDAVQEYVSIVLSNSVYPDHFPVTHTFQFDPASAELDLRVTVPEPSRMPKDKAYKYVKASDEIVATALSAKECRERYASAVHQVALRSLHEVFEADRRGLIRTISLEVGTSSVDPATGIRGYVPFVVVAAERESFMAFDLSAVVPTMTLERLGGAVSKNPYALDAVERSGVRRA
jgi:restriction system protein